MRVQKKKFCPRLWLKWLHWVFFFFVSPLQQLARLLPSLAAAYLQELIIYEAVLCDTRSHTHTHTHTLKTHSLSLDKKQKLSAFERERESSTFSRSQSFQLFHSIGLFFQPLQIFFPSGFFFSSFYEAQMIQEPGPLPLFSKCLWSRFIFPPRRIHPSLTINSVSLCNFTVFPWMLIASLCLDTTTLLPISFPEIHFTGSSFKNHPFSKSPKLPL